jgi:hypothetical protein
VKPSECLRIEVRRAACENRSAQLVRTKVSRSGAPSALL